MADDTNTPTPTEAKKPAATRRRAPRKTAPAGATGTATKKAPARKPAAKRTAAKTVSTAVAASATPAAPARRKTVAAKPRAAARPKPATPARSPVSASQHRTSTPKKGTKWGVAGIAGGLAAVGAVATAALLSLRGSTPKDEPASKDKAAHQPDGKDSSRSFAAGIADENTIPDKG